MNKIKCSAFVIALLTAAVSFSGCSSDRVDPCPAASVPVDTATLPVFEGTPPRLSYTAYIVKVSHDCDIHKFDKQVGASVDIAFRAQRPNGATRATYRVPYFVAIATEGRVLAKRQFTAQVSFEPGQSVVDFSDTVSSLTLTVGQDKKPAEYGIIVGFQLTRTQLDYNRRAGRYAP